METSRIAAAEAALDAFLERRIDERRKANEQAEEWLASERTYHTRRRRRNLEAWRDFYLRLSANHAKLADDFAAKASKLLREEVF